MQLTCLDCGANFSSGSALYRHLRVCGPMSHDEAFEEVGAELARAERHESEAPTLKAFRAEASREEQERSDREVFGLRRGQHLR